MPYILIVQVGADNYWTRETAQKRLEEITFISVNVRDFARERCIRDPEVRRRIGPWLDRVYVYVQQPPVAGAEDDKEAVEKYAGEWNRTLKGGRTWTLLMEKNGHYKFKGHQNNGTWTMRKSKEGKTLFVFGGTVWVVTEANIGLSGDINGFKAHIIDNKNHIVEAVRRANK